MEQAVAKLGAEVLDSILTAAMADPDTMRRIANDISPPTEQVQDYLTEVDTRCALFDEFREICQHYSMAPNATILGLFMIAPVSEIRVLLQSIRRLNVPQLRGTFVRGILGSALDGIRACTSLFSHLTFLLILIKIDLPKSRSPEAAAGPLGAVPTVILNEPGIPIPSGPVIRSGFSD